MIEAIVFFLLPLLSSIETLFFSLIYMHLVAQRRSPFRRGILCLWCVKRNLNLCHGTSKALESVKNESKMKKLWSSKNRGAKNCQKGKPLNTWKLITKQPNIFWTFLYCLCSKMICKAQVGPS